MSGKFALIIANTQYSDTHLAELSAPGKDADALAQILRAPDVCAFDEVNTLVNEPEPVSRRAIARFCANKKPDDLLLLYFSGHGIRDEQGRLFFATPDTDHTLLDATAIPAEFVTREMDSSRSRRQVLILDCCNSGAFAYGTKAATGPAASMGTASAFEGSGYGHVVLTATDATQFAWVGDRIIGEATSESLFTHFLVKGLEGEADRDGNGTITVDELYDYTYDQVVSQTRDQKPGKWAYKEQGKIVLTTQVRPEAIKPVPLDPELEEDLRSTRNYVREAAIKELGNILNGPNLGRALSAEQALQHVAAQDDSHALMRMAAQMLEEHRARKGIKPQEDLEERPEPTRPQEGRNDQPQADEQPEPQSYLPEAGRPVIIVPHIWTRWLSTLLNPRSRLALGMGSLVIVTIGVAAILGKFGGGGDAAREGPPVGTAASVAPPPSTVQPSPVATEARFETSVPPSPISPAATPTIDLSTPDRFGRWFFTALWTDRDFEFLWSNYLTSAYQQNASPKGFEEWAAWWRTVKQIDVNSVDVVQDDRRYAVIHVNVSFYLYDGRLLDHRAYDYQLLFDPTRRTWMFDHRAQ